MIQGIILAEKQRGIVSLMLDFLKINNNGINAIQIKNDKLKGGKLMANKIPVVMEYKYFSFCHYLKLLNP